MLDKATAWPFVEARRIVEALGNKLPEKGYVLFETGYGPSGLPHIGTFCENLRTVMVQRALEKLTGWPTKLVMFSDDMDGFRKVPGNLPNQQMLQDNLHKSLTSVPDPFETDESFAHHNNRRLRAFLDSFEFDYTFKSATEEYKAGRLNKGLTGILENYEAVMDIMLPTLGEERRKTYSPFLPVCPETGHVLQVPVIKTNPEKGTIVYRREDGEEVETLVTDGHCKLQWKPDFGMRWFVQDVDYEMSGKDLIDSVNLATRICRALGGQVPTTFIYEHFVDEEGAKISKSKGNGVSMEQWLQYGITESLALFTYRKPQSQKKIFLSLIPQVTDEYLKLLADYEAAEDDVARVDNPVWHIHRGDVPKAEEVSPITYSMLLNLVGTSATTPDAAYVWGVIQKYTEGVSPETHPVLDQMVAGAIRYYTDLILPNKQYRAPVEAERAMLEDLMKTLRGFKGSEPAEEIQTQIYEVGKRHYEKKELRSFFKALYEILFGHSNGPRMGGFVKIYGVEETLVLVESALQRQAA